MTSAPGLPRRLAGGIPGSALLAATARARIGAASRFTSSTNFAGLAITARRVFSDAFTGIAPSSAPVFIAQADGGIAGLIDTRFLYLALTPHRAAGQQVTGGNRSCTWWL